MAKAVPKKSVIRGTSSNDLLCMRSSHLTGPLYINALPVGLFQLAGSRPGAVSPFRRTNGRGAWR